MYRSHQNKMAAIISLIAAVAVNSLTIPLVKGNTWSYLYRNETYISVSGDSARYTGLLRFSIDSVKMVADTTFFSLSYFDSGSIRHSISSYWLPDSQKNVTLDTFKQFSQKYIVRYQLFQDTIVTVDTFFSPGYEIRLLSFIKQRDSTDDDIYHLSMNKTTDYVVTVNENSTALLYACYLKKSKFYGCLACCDYRIFDTIAWIPVVGLSSFAHFDAQDCYYFNGHDMHSNTYILISFNGTPIPPLSQLSVKPINTDHSTRCSTGSNQKILVLSGRNTKSGYLGPKGSGYFSLQGQKMGNFNRSQLIICR